MSITTTCPGCSATLQIEESAANVACPYCGTHFEVKLDGGAAPELRKTTPPAPEPLAPPTPLVEASESILPPAAPVSSGFYTPPATPSPSAADLYNPPIPGAPPAGDPYNPPISTSPLPPFGGTDQTYTPPPPFYEQMARQGGRLTGSRLWIAIAIAVFAIFCISCLCMVGLMGFIANRL